MARRWSGLSVLAETAMETWKEVAEEPLQGERPPPFSVVIDPAPPGEEAPPSEGEPVQIRITPF